MNRITLFILSALLISSCVSKKAFIEVQDEYAKFKNTSRDNLTKARNELKERDKQLTAYESATKLRNKELEIRSKHIKGLDEQIDFLKKTNSKLLDRMTNLTLLSKAGADSMRKSMETINEQSQYIENINAAIQRKDSLNLSFIVTLKRMLNDVSDEDMSVKARKGLVCISVSDKIFFPSNNANLSQRGEGTLEKIAKALNGHPDLDVLVEGHTDATPASGEGIKDNWDLSAKRATSIVRLLQTKYGVSPDRMIAGGRAEYAPKEYTSTAATASGESNKKLNRRTEIIVMPKLDQFFQALVNGQGR
jgi:chemotaxis protein MotB